MSSVAVEDSGRRASPRRRARRRGSAHGGCDSYFSFNPRIAIVSATDGSPTKTGWKRRSSAASFSMCLRYSSSVVAPTAATRRARASASAAAPRRRSALGHPGAHDRVQLVDEEDDLPLRILDLGEAAFSRSSNSPRYFAPASSAPTSSAQTRLPFRPSGTSPATIRCASPSAITVLPTPGSPIRTRFVLRPAREHLDHAADLLVAPDDRVEACPARRPRSGHGRTSRAPGRCLPDPGS